MLLLLRLKTLKIPTLSYRRFRGDMIKVYKLLNANENLSFDTFFFHRKNSQHKYTAINLKLTLTRKIQENTTFPAV